MILAFHNEPSLKASVMERLREHRRLDQIAQGFYFDGKNRGCHLGCLTHTNEGTHVTAERLFGIEQRIGYWLEAVFEGLPASDCAEWVIASTEVIPVGADMSKCHHHFAAWLFSESNLLTITDINREAIASVRRLHCRAAQGSTVSNEEWSAARSAAESAARSAAESAAWSAAWSAARSAARSAAESAARSAASAWNLIAEKSIEIFREAPVMHGSPAIDSCVQSELCVRRLWCPDGQLVKV